MMFSTQGSIASRCDFDFFASDLVVVGRVPMNQKRGKRQLERIAKAQDAAPIQPERKYQDRNRGESQPKPERKYQDRNRGESQPKSERKYQDRNRGESQPKSERKQDRKQRGESQPMPDRKQDRKQRGEIQPKPEPRAPVRIVVGPSAAVVRVVEMPAEVLAQVLALTGLSAVGALAATGRAAHSGLWGPQSALLWGGLGSGATSWDTFRIQHFGLAAGWLAELSALCAHEPLPGLQRACRLSAALLQTDREALALLPVLAQAALAAPCGPALELVDALLPTLRCSVLGSAGCVAAARDELQERTILADIDLLQERDHEALAFDYFDEAPAELPPPPQFWDELENLALAPSKDAFWDLEPDLEEVEPEAAPEAIPEAASRLLASEFLEALGARHGFAWQETVAAMTAIER